MENNQINEKLIKNILIDDFQNLVHEKIYIDKNLFDVCNDLIYSNSKISKCVSKTCKYCGCIDYTVKKSENFQNEICSKCKDELEREIGNHLYHLTSLCNLLNLNLYDSILKEYKKINIIGNFII